MNDLPINKLDKPVNCPGCFRDLEQELNLDTGGSHRVGVCGACGQIIIWDEGEARRATHPDMLGLILMNPVAVAGLVAQSLTMRRLALRRARGSKPETEREFIIRGCSVREPSLEDPLVPFDVEAIFDRLEQMTDEALIDHVIERQRAHGVGEADTLIQLIAAAGVVNVDAPRLRARLAETLAREGYPPP